MTELASNEPTTEPQAKSPYAAWLRIMAVLYDPFLWLGEVAGMLSRRRTLLAEAYGRVVAMGGCYSSNPSARSRGFWRRARTNSSKHGASSPAGAYATGRPWS